MMAGLVHLVAPLAKIIPLKAFNANGVGTEWNITRAIYDAVDMRADVINMSFSLSQNSKIVQRAVQYAASRGVILVGSSGNDNSSSTTFPASYEGTVAVSALDLNDQKASFSNFGRYVDLSAPGVYLTSTYPGGHWAWGSGTSDSAPLVSGVFALLLQHGTPGRSVREKVESGVDPINGPPEYQNMLGKGRINADKAVLPR